MLRSVELFAGAGGLGMGVALAGFKHDAVVEWNHKACETLRENQRRGVKLVRDWPLFEGDIRAFDFDAIPTGLDLLAGGPPCQGWSLGGKHRGWLDERNLFPEAVRAVRRLRPRVFMFENVKGLLRPSFSKYYEYVILQLTYPDVTAIDGEAWTEHLSRLERLRASGDSEGLRYHVEYRLLKRPPRAKTARTKTEQAKKVNGWYYVSCPRFTIAVFVRDGAIRWTPPIARKFVGQPFSNLRKWCKADKIQQLI